MTFESVLFLRAQVPSDHEPATEPRCFRDLNLDQVGRAIVAGRQGYDLEQYLYSPLQDVDSVVYRQEAVADLQRDAVRSAVDRFAAAMVTMRQRLSYSLKLDRAVHRQRSLREGMRLYGDAVIGLLEDLGGQTLTSSAFQGLRDHLSEYVRSHAFSALVSEGRVLDEELAAVRYAVSIRGPRVTVRKFSGGDDYSAEIEATFAKFRSGVVREYHFEFAQRGDLNHVEAQILELVARLQPDLFSRLDAYCSRNREFADARIMRFEREVQFFLAYLDFIEPLRRAGLEFCLPTMSAESKETEVVDGFDLALASKLVHEGGVVVCNDIALTGLERSIVVTGPNQGGKTTFARMFGQVHYLAGLGLPIPGRRARLFLADQVFTHFEREEHIEDLRGKLADELVRLREILELATDRSVVVMNEGFASTSLSDAVVIGTKVMLQVKALGALSIYVTFVDELASLDEATVSMVSLADEHDVSRRTLRVVRKPADGLAFALALATRYGLDYESLSGRIAS